MKLLFDHNLSRVLVERLRDIFPDSQHVLDAHLESQQDIDIWNYAERNGFIIVTKDADFHQFSVTRGHPPKVIWLRIGNRPTQAVADLLRNRQGDIREFAEIESESLLTVE